MGKWHLLHNQATHKNDEFLWKTNVVQIKHTLLYEHVTKAFSADHNHSKSLNVGTYIQPSH